MPLFGPSSARRVAWKNGLGSTLELATDAAAPGGPWTWRLSIAEVPARAPFSAFPEVDRAIVCVEGAGMRLLRAGSWVEVPRAGEAIAFAGEEMIEGEPAGEGVRDGNLMVRRDRWRAVMKLLREGSLRCDATLVLVHALRGAPPPYVACAEYTGLFDDGATLAASGPVAIDTRGAGDSCVVACTLWPRVDRP